MHFNHWNMTTIPYFLFSTRWTSLLFVQPAMQQQLPVRLLFPVQRSVTKMIKMLYK